MLFHVMKLIHAFHVFSGLNQGCINTGAVLHTRTVLPVMDLKVVAGCGARSLTFFLEILTTKAMEKHVSACTLCNLEKFHLR